MSETPTLISGLRDIEQIEQEPLVERMVAESTYRLLEHATARHKHRPALDFHLHATAHERGVSLTYDALFRKVTQTANMNRPILRVMADEDPAYIADLGS